MGTKINLIEDRKKWVDIVFIVLIALSAAFVATAILGYTGIFDQDHLWHYKLGEYIFKNHSIFKDDIFSWVAIENGYQETAHSWLTSLIMYFVYDGIMNLFHIDMNVAFLYVEFIYVFIYCIFVYLICFRKKRDFYLGYIFASFIVSIMVLGFKPKSVGMMLFLLMLYIIQKSQIHMKYRHWLILLTVLWSNLHGGSIPILFACILGFAFMSLFRYSGCIFILPNSANFKVRVSRCVKWLITCGCCFLAGMLNPYGIKLYIYFFVTNNAETKQFVNEWQPLTARSIPFWLIMFIIGLAVYNVEFAKKKLYLDYTALFLICFVASFLRLRYIEYAVLTSMIFLKDLIPGIYEVRLKPDVSGDDFDMKAFIRFNRWFMNGMLILILCIVNFCCVYVLRNAEPNYDVLLSQEEIDYIHDQSYQHIFNDYDTGAMFIYADIPCFVDSRGDLYKDHELSYANGFILAKLSTEQTDEFINKYQFDCVMLRDALYSANFYMQHRDDYVLDYTYGERNYYKKIK